MSKRSMAALLMGASLLMASAPGPAEQEPVEATRLYDGTAIESDGVRTGRLYVPEDARIDLNEDPDRPGNAMDVSIEGGGDGLVAVAIIPDGATAGYDLVRLPASESSFSGGIASLGSGCRDCELPAGLYDIIVASDSPVTITLSVDELDDAGTLPPSTLDRALNGGIFNEASLKTTYAEGAVLGGHGYSGAGWRDTTQVGSGRGSLQTFYAFWYEGVPASEVPDEELLVQAGLAVPCSYTDPVAAELLFQPGCPTGSTNGVLQVVAQQGREVGGLTFGWKSGIGAGDLAQGGIVAYPGVRDVGAAGYWVELP